MFPRMFPRMLSIPQKTAGSQQESSRFLLSLSPKYPRQDLSPDGGIVTVYQPQLSCENQTACRLASAKAADIRLCISRLAARSARISATKPTRRSISVSRPETVFA